MDTKGLKIYKGLAQKNDVVYAPAGYMIIEFVAKGPLISGVRRSFFLKDGGQKDSYGTAKTLFSNQKMNVERMVKILELLD